MKAVLSISVLLAVLIAVPAATFAENSQEYTEAELEWSQVHYRVTNGTGTAKIILIDPDTQNIPSYIDTVKVSVFSDSSRDGIILKLYETGKDTGIFERTFAFSDKRSAPSVLHARDWDTVTARYVDDTLSLDSEFESIELTATMFLGLTGPPMERAPITNARIVDRSGNSLSTIVLGEQIQIFSDIANNQNREQKFTWLTQIADSNRETVSLGWIDGILYNNTSFSPSLSWIPENKGQYTATMFAWESIDNPSALSPPIKIEFAVTKEKPEPKKPEKEITITIGDPISKNGLLPIITTEITANTELLDSVTDWHFLPLNHGEWGPSDDSRLSLDILPNENRQFDSTGESNCKEIEFDASFGRDDILQVYDADCMGEKIEILSADPISIIIPENLSSVSITTSESGLLPVDGMYTLRFASFFDQNVMLPENAVIVSSEEKRCAVNHEEYSSGRYVKVVFKLESYPDDFEFKYSFGVGEKNSYDSKNDLYVTDMVCDDPLITPVSLTETEKTIIWESISRNDFFQMGDFTQNCDDAGNCIVVEPESRITLFVAADGIKHSVSYRDSYIGKNGEPYSRFTSVTDTINEIFEEKEELKFLPKPRCGYL
ncbi:MAG: hypothetical protein GKS07_09125 [Nitrosopumilus sp.]|nr:MAG: hypothetical protein GKS07_09125 [Nitrosopumilus sp.]